MFQMCQSILITPITKSFRHNGADMTAIVWAYGLDGFIIAADGRRLDGDTREVACDVVQKIFSVKVDGLRLVYAWKGNAYLEAKKGPDIDFRTITDCIIQGLDIKNISTFAEVVEKFRDALFPISRMIFEQMLGQLPSDKPILGVVFLAYFGGYPYFAEIEIWHDGNQILRPTVECHPATGKFRIFSGSKMAHNEFGQCDTSSCVLSHLAAEAKRYIEICFKYQRVDCDASGIGGHIHMGKLEAQGYTWLIQPF